MLIEEAEGQGMHTIRIHNTTLSFSDLTFYPNHSPKEGTLSQDALIKIGKSDLLIYGVVKFYESGEIYSATLARGATLIMNKFEIQVQKDTKIIFFENLKIAMLYQTGRNTCKFAARMSFYENYEIIFGEDETIEEIHYTRPKNGDTA